MKGLKIALIAILGGLSLALLAGMIQIMNGQWGLFGNGNRGNGWHSNNWRNGWQGNDSWDGYNVWNGMGQPTLQRTTEHDMTDVSQLLVDCTDSPFDVIFLPGDGEKLVVEEYCTRTMEEGEFAKILTSAQSMEIRQTLSNQNTRKKFFIFSTMESNWGYLKLYLPQEAYASLEKLTVDTTSGDISLPEWQGLAPAQIKLREARFSASSGDVELKYVKAGRIEVSSTSGYITSGHMEAGLIKITASSGDVTLEKAAGDMTVSTNSGDVSVYTAEGALGISTGSGDVELDAIKGNTEISTTSGYIQAGKIDGNLKAKASSGDIEVKHVGGNAEAGTNSGYITFGEVLGSLTASSGSGSQDIDSVGGNVQTESTSGDQSIGSAGGSVGMKSSSGELELYGLQREARFQTTSGGVTAVITEMGGNVTVSSSSGDVRITAPRNGSFYFDAETSSGSIDTSFDDELEFNKRGNKASGTIGGDTYRMEIDTTSGSVEIRVH